MLINLSVLSLLAFATGAKSGTEAEAPQFPASSTPKKGEPAPMLPGDRPGPDRPTVQQDNVVLRDAAPDELLYTPRGGPPKKSALFMLSYRNYATKDQLQRSQSWHVVGLELSPARRYFRLSMITEVGFEGGEAAKDDRGDFFLMEKLGVGVQYPHWVTPYVELQGGAGIGRVELFERNDLGFLWSMGLDFGAQWSVSRRLRLMAAAGWIRPSMRHLGGEGKKEAVYFNRGTFKVGLGF